MATDNSTSGSPIKSSRAAPELAAYLIGAFLSAKLCAGYWYVGPIFGAVVLIWRYRRAGAAGSPGSLLFLLCSTLIYALVFRISGLKGPAWLAEPFGMLDFGVIAGSILLPAAHVLFLQGNFRQAGMTGVFLAVSYYFFLLLAYAFDKAGIRFDYWAYPVIYGWQGIYLSRFYSFR